MLSYKDRSQSRADSTFRYKKRSKSYRKSSSTSNVYSPRRRTSGKPISTRKRNACTPPRKITRQSNDLHPGCSSAIALNYLPVSDEILPIPRLIISACLSYCLFATKSGRTVESVTDDELLRAIDTTFRCVFCHEINSAAGAGAPVDTDGSSGTVGASGSKWQQSGGGSSTAAPTGAPSRYSIITAKRGRELDDDDNDEDEDQWRRKRPTSYNTPGDLESIIGRLWACPFFCFDQDTYRDCLQHRLTRISDVRTHIKRRHTQNPHCPICGLSFKSLKASDREHHVRMRACMLISDPGANYPGATEDMMDRISNRGNARHDQSPVDKWYSIWSILFPSRDKPADPYAPISEVAHVITSYLNRYTRPSSDQRLQSVAQQMSLDGNPMDDNALSIITRFCQFVIAQERQRESQRAQTSGDGNRDRHGRPALPPTILARPLPGGTPSLISGSTQFTFADNLSTQFGPTDGSQRTISGLMDNTSFVSPVAQVASQSSQCELRDGFIHQIHQVPSTQPLNYHALFGQQVPDLVGQRIPDPVEQRAPELDAEQPFPDLDSEGWEPLFTYLINNSNSFGPGGNPSWSRDQFS